MKMFIRFSGGPSPGLELLASRADLKAFAAELGAAVRQMEDDRREEGSISIGGLDARGDTLEWLSFRAVQEVDSAFAKTDATAKMRLYLYVPIAWALGLSILYFAYRGIQVMLA